MDQYSFHGYSEADGMPVYQAGSDGTQGTYFFAAPNDAPMTPSSSHQHHGSAQVAQPVGPGPVTRITVPAQPTTTTAADTESPEAVQEARRHKNNNSARRSRLKKMAGSMQVDAARQAWCNNAGYWKAIAFALAAQHPDPAEAIRAAAATTGLSLAKIPAFPEAEFEGYRQEAIKKFTDGEMAELGPEFLKTMEQAITLPQYPCPEILTVDLPGSGPAPAAGIVARGTKRGAQSTLGGPAPKRSATVGRSPGFVAPVAVATGPASVPAPVLSQHGVPPQAVYPAGSGGLAPWAYHGGQGGVMPPAGFQPAPLESPFFLSDELAALGPLMGEEAQQGDLGTAANAEEEGGGFLWPYPEEDHRHHGGDF